MRLQMETIIVRCWCSTKGKWA